MITRSKYIILDCTQMARDSPSKGFLIFSGNRLIQRRTLFWNRIVRIVAKAHEVSMLLSLVCNVITVCTSLLQFKDCEFRMSTYLKLTNI